MAFDPENLFRLVRNSVDVFSDDKRQKILETIKAIEGAKLNSVEQWVALNLQDYDANEFSGFKRFNKEKFLNAVLYFCTGAGEFKTKLNKLLFYSDFQHFKEYTNSITGTQYARVPFRPGSQQFRVIIFSCLSIGELLRSKK